MWLCLGWLCVGLAVVGTALPLMPTVPFVVAAAFCFERGSPRLHRWLMDHPVFGPPLKDWRENRVIRWPAKILACLGLTVSGGYTVFLSDRPEAVKWTVGLICLAAMIFILSRRSKPRGL